MLRELAESTLPNSNDYLSFVQKLVMKISRGNSVLIGATLIIIASGSRLLPHWHNFTAVGAAGLFGAYYFRKQIWAFIIPLLAMWVSDLLLNNWIYSAYNPEFVWFTETMLFVYLGFILLVLTGQICLTKLSGCRVLGASIAVSIVFFFISNFDQVYFFILYL